MTRITDQLKRPSWRKSVRGEVPEWWPAAQIVGAVLLISALVVSSLLHFGRKDQVTAPVEEPYTAPPAAIAPGFGTATTTPTSAPDTSSVTTMPAGDSSTTIAPSAQLPVEVDAYTVAVMQPDGSQKAVPVQSWLAARDHAALLYLNSAPTAATLLASSGSSNTFSITVSNGQTSSNVQVTTVLTSSGAWAAN
jgi:hypothetical protein